METFDKEAAPPRKKKSDARRPPRREGQTTLGAAFDRAMSGRDVPEELRILRTLYHWNAVVGEEMASCSRPLRLRCDRTGRKGKQGGGDGKQRGCSGCVLVLATLPGGMATVIQHEKPKIIHRINGFLGRKVVKDIQTLQIMRLPEKPKPDERPELVPLAVEGVQDPEFARTLGMYAAVAERRRQEAESG